MATNIVLLNKQQFTNKKIIPSKNFEHAKNHHITSLAVHEIQKAATNYPVVFTKDEESGSFKLVAIFGLSAGENVFFSEQGWNATYIPNNITRHPFGLTTDPEVPDKVYVTIDQDSVLLTENQGVRLYQENGEESEYLTQVKQQLQLMTEQNFMTEKFIATLTELDLLEAHTLTYTMSGGEKRSINGLYSVSEKKLMALEPELCQQLNSNGALAAIYAHLLSLHQFQRILKLKA